MGKEGKGRRGRHRKTRKSSPAPRRPAAARTQPPGRERGTKGWTVSPREEGELAFQPWAPAGCLLKCFTRPGLLSRSQQHPSPNLNERLSNDPRILPQVTGVHQHGQA